MSTWYREGTVSVTNGSPNVVGVGTFWRTQASVGDIFLGPNLVEYEITSITDDTHMTVRQVNGTDAYAGATASAQPYAIIRNFTSTLPAQLASKLADLMQAYHLTLDELTAWLSGTGTVTVHDAIGNSYPVQTPAAMNATLTGRLVKSVAGSGDITLTSAEAANLFHELTGTRTAVGNYIVPASARHYFVYNATAYAMTVKTPAGTGVSVGAGARMVVQCDGTNVVDAISYARLTGLGTTGNSGIGTLFPVARLHVSRPAVTGISQGDMYLSLGSAEFGAGSNRLIGAGYAPVDPSYFHPCVFGYVELSQVLGSAGAFVVSTRPIGSSAGVPPSERMRVHPSGGISINNTADPGAGNLSVSGTVVSGAHNTYDLGTTAVRWKDLWLQSAAFNASDARLKTPVSAMSQAEISAARQIASEIGIYQWLDAVAAKGASARLHIGLTVQRAIEIMQSHGLDWTRYGFIGYDQWGDVFVDHPEVAAVAAVLDEAGNVVTPETAFQAAWTEQTQKAGDAYSFRGDELDKFMFAGFASLASEFDARIAAIEASLGL